MGESNAGTELDMLGEVITPAGREFEDPAADEGDQDQGDSFVSDDLLGIFEEAGEEDLALKALAGEVEEIEARHLVDELHAFAREIGVE